MNIVLYGKHNGLSETQELLNSMIGIHNVSFFGSLASASEYLAQNTVDMLYLDADDKTMDWQYLAQEFRKVNNLIKIVLVSRDKDQSVRAFEAGIFDYLLKPVKKKQLERVVSKACYCNV